jgi:hypothetical protein
LAREQSREVLRVSHDENARDEALNLMACALWHDGQDDDALAALEQALNGQYSVNLVVNAALCAAELDPVRAAEHLAKIIREAPDVDMKVAAALIAVNTWWSNQDEFAYLVEDDDALPDVLAQPLRSLVRGSIPLEAFREIVAVLATADGEWLQSPGALAGSPWASSDEARYYTARAEGLVSACTVLGKVAGEGAPDWLVKERERTVDLIFRFLLTENDVPVVGLAAFELIDAKAPMSEDIRIPLAALAAREMAIFIGNHGDDPSARLAQHRVELIVWSAKNVDRVSAERRADAEEIVQGCASHVQYGILRGLSAEVSSALAQAPSYGYAQQQAFIRAFRQISQAWERELMTLRPYVDAEARQATDRFIQQVRNLT